MSSVMVESRELPILFTGPMWRQVVDYEDRYDISDQGNVRSLSSYHGRVPGTILKPWVNPKGYCYVTLRRDGRNKSEAVHRLVLTAFVGPCPAGKQAAHGNGDPSDNRLCNLRWASSAENIRDRARHGRTAHGEKIASAKLDRLAARTIKRLRDGHLSAYEVAHLASVDPSTVAAIWKGETWKHV